MQEICFKYIKKWFFMLLKSKKTNVYFEFVFNFLSLVKAIQ